MKRKHTPQIDFRFPSEPFKLVGEEVVQVPAKNQVKRWAQEAHRLIEQQTKELFPQQKER